MFDSYLISFTKAHSDFCMIMNCLVYLLLVFRSVVYLIYKEMWSDCNHALDLSCVVTETMTNITEVLAQFKTISSFEIQSFRYVY
jgi:hypothetical protein